MSERKGTPEREIAVPLAHDVWRAQRPELDHFFRPSTIAVIGATETPGSVGRTILWNLVSSPFGGTVFPVNPKRPILPGNLDMQRVCSKVGFELRHLPEDGVVQALLVLDAAASDQVQK